MPWDSTPVSRLAFHPRPGSVAPTFPVDLPDGTRLGCFLRSPHGPEALTVLHFHGNGELAEECDRHLGPWFTGLGVNVCFAEYRGYGASTGSAALAAMLPDGEAVVAALGVPPGRVVAFGRSLGSLYAIELARRLPALGGLILESGIASLPELVLFAPLAGLLARLSPFDHRAKLSSYTGPLLVLHALQDRLVPPSHGERLHAWAGGSDKRLALLPRGDHNSVHPANAAEYAREVAEFLGRVGLAAPSLGT